MWKKEFPESEQDHRSRTNLNVKVLDFVKSGGPGGTVLRTFSWEVALRVSIGSMDQ